MERDELISRVEAARMEALRRGRADKGPQPPFQ